MFFMNSEIRTKDVIWDIYDTEEIEVPIFELTRFVDNFQVYTPNTPTKDRKYVQIYFRADAERRIYKREEYDMLTFLGDLGGLIDVVLLVGWSLTSLFASRLFQAALITQAYKL